MERTIRFDRLLELAEHLESGKTGHKKFDFSAFNSVKKPKCGTSGCAIGEAPIRWPDAWEYGKDGMPRVKEIARESLDLYDDLIDIDASINDWFGLDTHEARHLFYPYSQSPNIYGGRSLGNSARREQVVVNIRAFCEKMREPVTVN